MRANYQDSAFIPQQSSISLAIIKIQPFGGGV